LHGFCVVILQVEKHANFLDLFLRERGFGTVYEGGTDLLTL
jgi:hypothetical protein